MKEFCKHVSLMYHLKNKLLNLKNQDICLQSPQNSLKKTIFLSEGGLGQIKTGQRRFFDPLKIF